MSHSDGRQWNDGGRKAKEPCGRGRALDADSRHRRPGVDRVLHLTRGTAVRHVRGVGADSVPVAVSEPEFPLSVAMLTGASLLSGNRVDVALNGDGTYERLWQDLRAARRSIALQLYYGHPGRMGDTLRDTLTERTRAGVRVFLLYDAFGSQDIPRDHLVALRASGVFVEAFRPLRLSTLHLFQNRSHVRGIVVDGRIGWTGGFGIDDKWLGDGHSPTSWRETNVRFEGPAVRQLQAAFAGAWAETTGSLFTRRATVERYEGGAAEAGLLSTTPTLGSTSAERFVAISIAGAQKTLYITNSYFAPESNFVGLLTDAARRGVDVRILTAGPATDVRTVGWPVAHGTTRCWLQAFACTNGSPRRCTRRPLSSTASGQRLAR